MTETETTETETTVRAYLRREKTATGSVNLFSCFRDGLLPVNGVPLETVLVRMERSPDEVPPEDWQFSERVLSSFAAALTAQFAVLEALDGKLEQREIMIRLLADTLRVAVAEVPK